MTDLRTMTAGLEAELVQIHMDLAALRASPDDSDEADAAACKLTEQMCVVSSQVAALQGDTNASLRWARLGAEWARRHIEAKQNIHTAIHAAVKEALARLDAMDAAASALADLDDDTGPDRPPEPEDLPLP